MQKISSSKAFTLVELIVVIVILAILATIAFLSFSSQTSGARDAKRLSDISNIAKGLSMNNALTGKYPIPDSNISITASGNLILMQGFAGSSVLNIIRLSDGGKDPLDNDTYYTYSVDAKQSRFQLLGFLEDGSNSALSLSPGFAKPAFAEPRSYSGRYAYTKGDELIVLLSSGTLLPMQSQYDASAFARVDVMTTDKELSMLMPDKQMVSGTGIILRGMIGGAGLLGYWSFDEGMGTAAKDYSGNGNDGALSGTSGPSWTGGILGKALFFNNPTQTGFLDIGSSQSLSPRYIDLNLWFRSDGTMPSPSVRLFRNRLYGYGVGYSGGILTCNFMYGVGLNSPISTTSPITDNEWHNIHCGYSPTKLYIYIDGIKVAESPNISAPIYYVGNHVGIGKDADGSGGYYYGYIDEVRVYDRSLSDLEISTLYKIAK